MNNKKRHQYIFFKVIPREMFIPPKGNASLIIDIQLEKYKTMMNKSIEGEFVCKILGFIRIAPSDMFV